MANKVLLNVCLKRWMHVPIFVLKLIEGHTSRRVWNGHKGSRILYPTISQVSFLSQSVPPYSANQKDKRIKSSTFIKINLIETDGKLTVTSLEEAEKLAKRRDLKLVKIVDGVTKSQRPSYKLQSAAQYFEEELKLRKLKSEKKKTEMKAEKLLSLSDKIDNHDLESKVKKMRKWLEKRHEVRVSITESEGSLSERVCNVIETGVKEVGKIVQKRKKGKEIKFSVLPFIKNEEQIEEPNDKQNQ